MQKKDKVSNKIMQRDLQKRRYTEIIFLSKMCKISWCALKLWFVSFHFLHKFGSFKGYILNITLLKGLTKGVTCDQSLGLQWHSKIQLVGFCHLVNVIFPFVYQLVDDIGFFLFGIQAFM